MLKKFLIGIGAIVGVVALAFAAVMLDRAPTKLFGGKLTGALMGSVTKNMFVSEDNDDFSPGLSIGAQFPAIRARFQGAEITNIERFVKDRGAVFIAVRSADW
jgi:hypothetical protein